LVAKQNKGKIFIAHRGHRPRKICGGRCDEYPDSLNWAGVIPDEGVKFDKHLDISQEGKDGPYIQSERLEIYKKYVDQLVEAGHAYYCFCSPERLQELRDNQQRNKLPTKYDKRCLNINLEEAKKRVAAGEKHVVRLKMPETGETVFNDLIRGEVSF